VAIGGGACGVASIFELLHQGLRDFCFGFCNGAPDAQPGVGLDGRPAPEGAAVGLFLAPPFSPVWPT